MSDPTAIAGTSSTPATGDPPAPAASPPAALPTASPEPKPTPVVAEPAKSVTDPAKPAEPVKTEPPATDPEPLFKLPDDLKIAAEAQSKFETFVKGKLTDGKLTLTPQEVVDLYAEQARDAFTRWQTQQTEFNAANEAECKQRFTQAQLAASETGVGFLSSFDPQFREVAKAFLNHPTFVNAMRIVGERLSEDSFEIGSSRAEPARKQPKDVLYGKRN